MEKLKLILPRKGDKEKILDYKEEFLKSGDSIDGSSGLKEIESFEKWYKRVCDNLKEETVLEGLVPSSTYLVLDCNDKLVGMVDIRHRLNGYLENFGGHVGYSVRKSERKKGYGTEILKLGLKECKNLNIDKVLVTCDENNVASSKIILNCGGVLENKVERDNGITRRYWINL